MRARAISLISRHRLNGTRQPRQDRCALLGQAVERKTEKKCGNYKKGRALELKANRDATSLSRVTDTFRVWPPFGLIPTGATRSALCHNRTLPNKAAALAPGQFTTYKILGSGDRRGAPLCICPCCCSY